MLRATFARVWTLARPDAALVARYVDAQRALPFTYAAVGATDRVEAPPAGFVLDHNRELLDRGSAAFARACDAIRGWRMFPVSWTAIGPPLPAIAVGEPVAVSIRILGGWWLNAARIAYAIDEPRRFGFAYGTLPGHAECGEERFLVEWLADDTVWYDLRAFSRPRHWLARLGTPATRALQRRFARDSKLAMRRAV